MSKQVTRRSFIAGAGILAVGAAGAGLAACAPQPEATGSSNTAEGPEQFAGGKGRWSWSEAPEPISDDQIAEVLDCEVLIIGAGSTGVAAATYATSQGANTVIMTKGDFVEKLGFNVAAYNSKHNAEFGIEYDPAWWRKDMTFYYQGKCNVPMMGTLFDRSGEALDWFTEYMDDSYPSAYFTNTGLMMMGDEGASHIVYVWPDDDPEAPPTPESMETGMSKMFNAAQKRIEENGGRFLFATPAVQLVLDGEGRVAGAIGLNKQGEYVKVNASKGVVLGCGDIVHDDEMLECYCPQMLGAKSRNSFGTCTGDGVRMGLWIDAKVETAPWAPSQTYPHADLIASDPNNQVVNWFLASTTWMRVNKAAKRFVNESIWMDERWGAESLYLANSDQPDQTCYAICDADFAIQTDPDPRGLTAGFEAQVSDGTIKSAETIEELAALIELDPATLGQSVDRYNEFCAAGRDGDFGVDGALLSPIQKPPFYALEFTVYNSAAFGGLWTDEYFRVVNKDLQVIDGLYAAGNCLGGRGGFMYSPDLRYTASFKTAAMAGGILTVKHMLGGWDEAF